MTDEELAKKIRTAVADFNVGLALAAERGLKVNWGTLEVNTIGHPSHDTFYVESIQKVEVTEL